MSTRGWSAIAAALWVMTMSAAMMGAGPAVAAETSETAPTGSPAALGGGTTEAWAKAALPGPRHLALADRAGAWAVTVRVWLDPAQPPEVSEGTSERTMILGGRVLEETFSSAGMGDQPYEGLGHTGYDNVTGRYWSTWTDNMMTGVAVFYGAAEESGAEAKDTLVMEGEMPDPIAGKAVPMRIETRVDADGQEVDDFFEAGPDGKLIKTMEITYRRR